MTIPHHTKSWFPWSCTTSCTKFGNKKRLWKNYREHSSSTNSSDVNNDNNKNEWKQKLSRDDGENGRVGALLWEVLWPDTSAQLVHVRATMIHLK
mmetsp:Transcript_42302/g.101866  ORF Transcript_42302/g.101866 Transcript_42302/m.101866 type:complete len:95 (-) Transcript_42302:2054-2338(-)